MSEELKKDEGYDPDIISLSDDEGKEYTFEVLDAIETDTDRYLALLPMYDDPKKMLDDSGELVIVKVKEEDGEEYFCEIEDDDEYETIADAFVDRLENFFEIDDLPRLCRVRKKGARSHSVDTHLNLCLGYLKAHYGRVGVF